MPQAKDTLIVEVIGADRAEAQLRRASRAVKQWDRNVSMNIKKLALWSVGARTTFLVFMQARQYLRESYEAVYQNTEEYKQLEEAVTEVGRALIIAITGGSDWLDFLAEAARDLEILTQDILEYNAVLRGGAAAYEEVMPLPYLGSTPLVEELTGATMAYLEQIGLLPEGLGGAAAFQKEYNRVLKDSKDLLEESGESAADYEDRLRDLQRSAERLTTLSMRHADIMDDYAVAVDKAGETFREGLVDAQKEYEADIKKAETRAFKDREAAWKDYYRRLDRIHRDQQDQTSNLEERHRLQMEFAERHHVLNLLNSEALYQYERGRLVAEGDVLAIEDLDARYELERQATEENFRLQQQQAEAMFQLQLRQQQQAMEQQREDLWAALQQRLQDIEEARRERRHEAEVERQEAREEAKEEYNEEMDDQKEALKKRLKDQADFWAKYLMDMEIGFGEAQNIIQAQFGTGSASEKYFTEFWTRRETELARFTAMLGGAMGLPIGGGSATQRLRNIFGGGFQYGGEFIANRPTSIMVGEGYAPERVSVQPLSPIGGSLAVRWQGGAIPVHGSGSLSGAEMSGVGQAIAQGLVTEMRSQINSYRGQRGG